MWSSTTSRRGERWSRLGRQASNALVYESCGAAKMSATAPCSRTMPFRITTTWSAISPTTPRSWLMNSMLIRCRSLRPASSSRIWRWIVTSSAVVGSSAIRSLGSQASAIAIMTRCCWPPESWCGYADRRRFGSGMPTSASSASARAVAWRAPRPRCFLSGSAICWPTVNTGLSELIGSWNTQAMSRPRSACSCASDAASRSRPWNVIEPLRSALSGSRLRIDIAVTLLPEPDSPTSATVVFSGSSKLTPLTASTRRMTPSSRPMRNDTRRSAIESNGAPVRRAGTALIRAPSAWDRGRRAASRS